MKKLFLSLSVTMSVISGLAAPLSPQQALQRASSSSEVKKINNLRINDLKLVKTGYTTADQPAFYVFTGSSGSLFLSADDIAKPILGYTDSGNFDVDSVPPALQWWLGEYSRELEWAFSGSGSAVSQSEKSSHGSKAKRVASAPRQPISPMISTIWNQDTPFNNYCPELYGEKTVTGCVATSMAQVMNYFQWPQKEVMPISYTWNDKKLTSPKVTLDWDNMIDSYNGEYTERQADAVARLMQIAGYSVSMKYNISENGGSGAYSTDIRTAMVNLFGYDVSTNYIVRHYYTSPEWTDMIYNNLLNFGPVIYNGRSDEGGHSFVCDGYDGNEFFHINWGWGGVSDGYFLLSVLDPDELGAGGGSGAFNKDQGAVINLQLPQPNSVAPDVFIGCSTGIVGSSDGRLLTIGASDEGGYWNYGVVDALFYFGVSLENKSTEEIYNIESFDVYLAPNFGYYDYWTTIPSGIPDGIYTVRPIYRLEGGEWTNVRFPTTFPKPKDSFDIKITSSEITVIEENPNSFSIISAETETEFAAGTDYKFYVEVMNNRSVDQEVTVSTDLCLLKIDQIDPVQELGSATVTIPAYSTEKIKFEGWLGNIAAGNYLIFISIDGETVAYCEIEVTDDGEFLIVGGQYRDFVVDGEYNVQVVVESSYNTPHVCSYDAYLCTEEGNGFKIVEELGNSTVTIDGRSSDVLTYSGTLSKVEPGKYFLVIGENYKVIGYEEVEVYAGDIYLKSVVVEPYSLVPGKDSTVDFILGQTYQTWETKEFTLNLYSPSDDGDIVYDSYGSLEVELIPGEDINLHFTCNLPEEINDGEAYFGLYTDDGRCIYSDWITIDSNFLSGIESVRADPSGHSYRYFNLQGFEVPKEDLTPGLCIRLDGEVPTKVLVK